MKKLLIIIALTATVISSCKKEDPVIEVTPAMARDTLYAIMKDWYYWYNKMPSVNRENYPDPYTLIEALRYKELDRWSRVVDYKKFTDQMKGTFVGHGISLGLDDSRYARIATIDPGSPLYAEGVRRGWIVKSVNGYDIADILYRNDFDAYNEAFGPSTAGITVIFVFSPPGQPDVTISSAKKQFTLKTVMLADTIHLSNGKVAGHMVLDSFIEPTENELKEAFSFFKECNVGDFILDLRYNTGGYLDIAQKLASYIGGNSLVGSVFLKLRYNDKNQGENSVYPFVPTLYPRTVKKLVVITTRATASASEAVMSGLSPKITVVSVGDTTEGKPAGMNGWPCAEKWYFWPVTFTTFNSIDQGEYFDGIPPDRTAVDDITHDFDDRKEACLKEAIYYLETGGFPGKGGGSFRQKVRFSEKPEWMNNIFIRKK